MFYWPVIALAQASILFLYRRLFLTTHFRFTSLALIAVVAAWGIVASIIEIFYPGHPINYYFGDSIGTTFNVTYLTFWRMLENFRYRSAADFDSVAMSIIELVVNILILTLPISEILKLQLSRRKKFGLSVVFLLGGFVIITGIVRIATLYIPTAADSKLAPLLSVGFH